MNKGNSPVFYLPNFNMNEYIFYLDNFGLKKTWNFIIQTISDKTINELNQTFLKFDYLSELYEFSLAYTNKINKKELGKYYTPNDVSALMSELLLENENIETLVDVACGTGNLIVEVIKQLQEKKLFDIIKFIKNGNLWLYDTDQLALKISIAKIEILLQEKIGKFIHCQANDFLNNKVSLPNNCSVITNPPYKVFTRFKSKWEKTDVLMQSKDLYAGFVDKILSYAKNAVIVSPQSFLVSDKFTKLRIKMGSNYYGEIFSFDNVPGALFNGRKYGIFNTNNANGVRAAITSIKKNGHQGFRLTHLIRFKSDQRQEVINLKFLRSKMGEKVQDLTTPIKSFKELEPFVEKIINNTSSLKVENLLETNRELQNEELKIVVSSSARYFIVGSKRNLDRNGYYYIYAKNKDNFDLLYGLLNSSYIYMWYRFYDGGILLTKSKLFKIPIEPNLLDKVNQIKEIVQKMINDESNFLTYKKNAGKKQESIKFPSEYREEINKIMFPDYSNLFTLLHNNREVTEND